jgi:hypothetical protein
MRLLLVGGLRFDPVNLADPERVGSLTVGTHVPTHKQPRLTYVALKGRYINPSRIAEEHQAGI